MNSDPEIVGWRTIIDEHESLQALRLCAIIQVNLRWYFIQQILNFFLAGGCHLWFLLYLQTVEANRLLRKKSDRLALSWNQRRCFNQWSLWNHFLAFWRTVNSTLPNISSIYCVQFHRMHRCKFIFIRGPKGRTFLALISVLNNFRP